MPKKKNLHTLSTKSKLNLNVNSLDSFNEMGEISEIL